MKYSLILAMIVVSVTLTSTLTSNLYGQTNSNSNSQIMRITAKLQEDDNRFLENWYEMNDFTMTLPEDSLVCPSGQCNIELENGKFRKNSFSDD
jgi:hypothetical protein